MKCYICGEGQLSEARETLSYDALPGVSLVGIRVETCPVCGERFEEIPAPAQLTALLAERLVLKRSRLTPVEIRFLRKSLGLSSGDFARKMRVSKATVSRWEHGTQMMSPQNDLLLRFFVATERPIERFADLYDSAATAEPASLELVAAHRERWLVAA